MTASSVEPPPEAFNFALYLLNANAGRPDKPAFIDDAGQVTYGELDERVRRFAAGLKAIGVRREERVLLFSTGIIRQAHYKPSSSSDARRSTPPRLFPSRRIVTIPPRARLRAWTNRFARAVFALNDLATSGLCVTQSAPLVRTIRRLNPSPVKLRGRRPRGLRLVRSPPERAADMGVPARGATRR